MQLLNFKALSKNDKDEGMTLKEVLAIIAIVGILIIFIGGSLLPYKSNAKGKAQRINCLNNLRQIGSGMIAWTMDHKTNDLSSNSQAERKRMLSSGIAYQQFQAYSNYINSGWVVGCPTDEERFAIPDISNVRDSNISYFVAMELEGTTPQSILAGDRNLMTNGMLIGPGPAFIKSNYSLKWSDKMHRGAGNILSGDGAARWVNNTELQRLLPLTSSDANRLVFP